jgi:DNA-binding transcriptional MocR family regulator
MVCPACHSASQIFIDAGLHGSLRAIPENGEGIDIDYLEESMREYLREQSADELTTCKHQHVKMCHAQRKFYSQVIYTVPTFSNPSGKTMSLRCRRKLVQLARQYDALVIADDVYDFLQWNINGKEATDSKGALMPRLVDIDRQLSKEPNSDGFGHAISNGTFSKIVAPGCRTGWVEATKNFITGLSKLGSRVSGGSPSQLSAAFISRLLRSGKLQRHIFQVLQPAYQSRYHIMTLSVRDHLQPLGVEMVQCDVGGISGGYFLWLRLSETLEADRVAEECRVKQNLILGSGTLFNVHGDEDIVNLSHNIRLCFSWEDENLLKEGVRRLAAAIKSLS